MKGALFLLLFLIGSACLADSFLVFEENGKMGIKDQQGKVVVPASFEALGWSDGSFSVIGDVTGYRLNNHWGILNLKKEFVTKAEYERLVYSSGEYIVATKKINPVQTKTGCLNLRGEIKIPFEYDGININGLRAVVFNLQNARFLYGLTDLENQLIIPVVYKRIYPLGTLRYAVENEAGKIALFGEDGRAITEFKIDSISGFNKSRAIIYQNLNQGLLDRDGRMVVDPNYQAIKIEEEKVIALPHHEWIILNERNEIQKKFQADEIRLIANGISIYKYSQKYGLLDSSLKVLLPAQYDHLYPFGSDQFVVSKKGKRGVIGSDNTIHIPLIYDSLIIEDDIARVYKKTAGWSLTDVRQSVKTQKNYNWIASKMQGIYPVRNYGYWGALNEAGEEIIHCVFDSLFEISATQLVVKFKNQFGIINMREDWLVAPQPFELRLVNDSCYLQLQPQNKFLRKVTGEVIYFTDNQIEFKDDYWIETLPDGTIKTLDYHGRLLQRVEPLLLDKLEEVFPESEGMRGIKRDGKFGFVDSRGRLRIANRYDGIGEFHEGLAPVKLIGKWGYLNQQDQIVINPNFESVERFINGVSIVRKNGKTGVIDKNGKTVIEYQYDSIQVQYNKKLRLYKKGLIGLVDQNGSILIEPRFDHLQELENGFVIAGREGKFGLISVTGLSIIPPIYDTLSYDSARNQYLALKKSDWRELLLK
ncbi:MAG: WG repeat-containing protein [Cyclobacteriaceae bacterium]